MVFWLKSVGLKNDSTIRYCSWSSYCRLRKLTIGKEREPCFVKQDMAGGDYSASLEIKAPISTVISLVAKKNARCGTGTKLMRRGCNLIRKTNIRKHADGYMMVVHRGAERGGRATRLAGMAIKEVSRRG